MLWDKLRFGRHSKVSSKILCHCFPALDLNLKIGEVVQNLDIKTMAEQWKAYTALCDKYCKYIEDGHIYEKCTDMLCEMIRSNLKNAFEVNVVKLFGVKQLFIMELLHISWVPS